MQEFISLMKSRNATFFPALPQSDITLANTALQDTRAAMLPNFLFELYNQCSGTTSAVSMVGNKSESLAESSIILRASS